MSTRITVNGESRLVDAGPDTPHKKLAADMARVFQQFGHLLKKMLEQLAVRTEDGRLIYQDMLCMSWVDVCDADEFSSQVAPTHVSPQPSAASDNQR